MGNDVLYTNQGACSQGFPNDDLIFERLENALGIEPINKPAPAFDTDPGQGPACSLEDGPKEDAEKGFLAVHPSQPTTTGCGCGCSPPTPIPSKGSGCC